MKRSSVHLVATLILALLATGVAEARISNHLHVLLAIDTDAGDAGIPDDLGIWSQVLSEIRQGHEGRVSVTVLKGRDLTPENVLGVYRNLGKRPDWALLFIYSGHGATDANREHLLTFKHGTLTRSALRTAMEDTGSNLQVLLTDCCGTTAAFESPRRGVPAEWAMFEQLFFEAGGMVDILGSEVGQPSIGFDGIGGLFTNACTNLLCSPVYVSDLDDDGRVTWPEFFGKVKADTRELAQAAGERQVPSSWYLGGRKRLDHVLAAAEARLAQQDARIAALEDRANAAAAGRTVRTRTQAIREVDACRLGIVQARNEVSVIGGRVNGMALAAERSGLTDATFVDRVNDYIRHAEGTVAASDRTAGDMYAWIRRAVSGGYSGCH